MRRNKFSYIVYAIIGLAIIGLVSQIFIDPAALFKSILIMIGMAVVILAVFYLVFFKSHRNKNNDETKKYKQAVKQSQRKYKNSNPKQIIKAGGKNQPVLLNKKNKRRASHLRVINGTGNKQNQKNEPHFK